MGIELLQRAINFMEEQLLEDIGYVEAAKSVHMSGYSFHRVFSFTVGMTANEYIRRRRLSLAGQELRAGNISVLDAALKYGYESPESFTKAFAKFHGSTPRQVKAGGAALRLFDPLMIKITIGGGGMLEYRLEHGERMRFIVVKRAFDNETLLDREGRSIPDFWTECGEKGLIEPMQKLCPEGERDLYGLCGPVRKSETEFYYGIGIRDNGRIGELAEGEYDLWETEPADYAVFKCKGPDGECIGAAWDRFFKEFCPQTGYAQTDAPDFELYYERGEPGVFCELWVPVRK